MFADEGQLLGGRLVTGARGPVAQFPVLGAVCYSSDMDSVLLVEKADGVATLTLNRPAAMNALSRELRTRIIEVFAELSVDADVGVVILTGAGRAFCAGLDLKELSRPDGSTEDAIAERDLVGTISRFDRPVIGAINGFAITGGFELALACDVLVASTEAKFADTHARVGIMPGWGLSQKLSRTVGIYRAKELSLTGNYLSAERAADWGLVNRVVAPEDLMPTCLSLAQDMLSCVPEVAQAYKRLIDDGYAVAYQDGLRLEGERVKAHARSVSAEQLAARRASVQERGRAQSKT